MYAPLDMERTRQWLGTRTEKKPTGRLQPEIPSFETSQHECIQGVNVADEIKEKNSSSQGAYPPRGSNPIRIGAQGTPSWASEMALAVSIVSGAPA